MCCREVTQCPNYTKAAPASGPPGYPNLSSASTNVNGGPGSKPSTTAIPRRSWGDDEAVIVDAKAAKPNPSHEIQVMLYMTWLPMIDPRFQKVKLSGEVYYREEAVIDISAASVNDRFKEITAGLTGRVTSKTPPRRAPSDSECRFCPISSRYCPERREI